MRMQDFVSVNISLMHLKITVYQMEACLSQLSFNFALGLCFLKKVPLCALEQRQVDVKRSCTCNSHARSNWTLWRLFGPGINQKKVLVRKEKCKKIRFHVSCETASSDRGSHNVTGIRRSSVSSYSQKGETFVVLLYRQFKNGRPIRNMVKCRRVQYDLILCVIGVGGSLRIVCHFTETGVGVVLGAVISVTVGQMLTKSSDLDV